MKRVAQFFLAVILLLVTFASASAAASDVELLKLSMYDYHYIDAFGQYQKCSSNTTWFITVVQNGTGSAYTLKMPSEVSITGWYGTKHPMSNFTYKTMEYGNTDYNNSNFTQVPFNGTITIPAYTTFAIYSEIGDLEQYNLYWDTDVFFNIMIDNTALPVQGILMQRGNGCDADAICTAEIIDGAYNSDGGDGVFTVKVKDDMPDGAYITADPQLRVKGIAASGEALDEILLNTITWSSPSFTLAAGGSKTITGTYTLPRDIAEANHELEMTVYLSFPTSLFFGDFTASKTITSRGGVHGIMSATYASNGSSGQFEASLTNHLSETVTLNKPDSGLIKTGSSSSTVYYDWDEPGTTEIPAESSISLSGSFTFDKRSIAQSNNALVISAEFPYAAETEAGSTFIASGTAARDADPNPTLSSLGMCRDYTVNNKNVYVEYSIRNNSSIDIPTQLATTLAVEDNVANAKITYTGCESYPDGNGAMESCVSRIDSSSYITLEPGEVIKVKGTVNVSTALSSAEKYVRTALVYFPDGVRTVLFVGLSTDGCQDYVYTEVPTDTPEETPEPDETVTPVEDDPAITDPDQPDETDVPATDEPGDEMEATPTPAPEGSSAVLSATGRSGTYSPCAGDKELTFDYSIVNSGTAETQLDVSQIYFYSGDTVLQNVTYTSCLMQDSGGVDPTCSDTLDDGPLTLFPGQTLSLEASWQPAEAIQTSNFDFIGRSREFTDLNFEINALKDGEYCDAEVEPIAGDDGNAVQSNVDTSTGAQASLSLTLSNSSGDDSVILPQAVYLQTASIIGYSAIGEIIPNAGKAVSKASIPIIYGQEFILPANSSVLITLMLNLSAEGMPHGQTAVNWNFKVGNTTENFTGQIDLPDASQLSSGNAIPQGTGQDTPADSQESPSQPVAQEPLPQQPQQPQNDPVTPAVMSPVSTSAELPTVFWKEEQNFVNMPATGFPTGRRTILPNQPTALDYHVVNGLHIEIPKLDTSADIVAVPIDENDNWAVEWLGERTGVLDGGVLPGGGTSIIAGHNHIDTGHAGPFAYLNQLADNDRIFVTNDKNELLIYRVYENELIEPMNGANIYKSAIPGSLVLITCESEKPEGGYAYRRLVFAEPMQ